MPFPRLGFIMGLKYDYDLTLLAALGRLEVHFAPCYLRPLHQSTIPKESELVDEGQDN